jgi:hypothetical protein
VNIKRCLVGALLAVGLVFATLSPAMATDGPEGVPITHGHYFTDASIGSVATPLSLAYAWLDKGKTWSFSAPGHPSDVTLKFQSDDNLVMYKNGTTVLWASHTVGSGATQLLFQRDGNLVLYTAGYQKAVWSSKSQNKCLSPEQPALSTQSDGNMVIYCGTVLILGGEFGWLGDKAVWSTRTNGS